jgi:hypothetical protein
VVSNTYCVVFLFCLSSSCVPYVVSFSGLSIFDCHIRYSLTFIYILFFFFRDNLDVVEIRYCFVYFHVVFTTLHR